MNTKKVVVLGAGMAGLATATRLAEAGLHVVLVDMSPHAGGRCRSFYDDVLDVDIDNGNHLVLNGNTDVHRFVRRIGSNTSLEVLPPTFRFFDLSDHSRWDLKLDNGFVPWWIFSKVRRVPGTSIGQYWQSRKVIAARENETVEQVLGPSAALYEKFWKPLTIAVLNTNPREAAAILMKPFFREILFKGGQASRPMLPHDSLSKSFVDPAIDYLKRQESDLRFRERCIGLGGTQSRIAEIGFASGQQIRLNENDHIVVALPPNETKKLLPECDVPSDFRPIVNVHFKCAIPVGFPKIIGVLNGTSEWVFVKKNVISVTISDAGALIDQTGPDIASNVWPEVRRIFSEHGLPSSLPEFRVIKEKRATIAQTPQSNARRPLATTPFVNLWLAGDWTQTGLPATIEGALRSGHHAAKQILKSQ